MSSFRKTSVLAVIAALGAFSTFTSAAEGATPSAPARSVAVSYGHLDLSDTRGMEYNPLTRRYRLSGDTSVNYLVACRKPA